MLARRWLVCLAAALAAAPAAHAQTALLTEAPLVDGCVRVELTLELDGKITVQQDGKSLAFPHKAQARHVYLERYLEATGAVADKAARYYATAEGAITFNNQVAKRALRPARAFMVAHRGKEQLVTYSPKGALTREEMELTEHFDTLAVAGLVPGKQAAVGDTWKLTTGLAAQLCDLDGLTEHDLTCKLESVKDPLATVTITGSVTGIDLGAQVKMLVTGRYEFDVKQQRLVALEWKQSDQRQQGPISPALSADVIIKLTRTPVAEPEELNKIALVPISGDKTPPASLTGVGYRDPKGRFELQHARDWHVVSPEGDEQLVLRLMERGDFVAQATVTPWKKADPKGGVTLDEFADLMSKTPGWEEDERIEKTTVDGPTGQKVYRVTATGQLDGVKTVQSFHLVVGPQGDQVIVTFSMVPTQVQRLDSRDLALVRNFTFPAAAEETKSAASK